MVVGGVWVLGAVFAFGRAAKLASAPQPSGTRERLKLGERVAFRVLAVPAILFGLGLLVLGGWFVWNEDEATGWRRVMAVVVSKEPTFLGTRLCFRFHTGLGETTSCEFRWGSGEGALAALK